MSIEQQISRINNVRKQLELLEAELTDLREQCKQQPEFEYPIYMQSKANKAVAKFDSLTSATVVVVDVYKNFYVGYIANDWIQHTNTDHWQPIAFDEERGIADKQLCECWDDIWTHCKVLRFYDAKKRLSFSAKGERYYSLATYDNYRPIPYTEYPQWAIEAEKTLRD